MEEYWAIKNLKTGLYFRGKGTNRWGKHFNQVSIYRIKGMADSFCEKINALNRADEEAVVVSIKVIELVVED